mgnify:CR=1 FL=1
MSDEIEVVGRSGCWEPIAECPFCQLTAATAINNNVSMPMAEVRGARPSGEPDVWIRCDCLGRPVSLYEEALRRHERDHGRRKSRDQRWDGLARVIWEESWGRRDRNAPSQSEATGRAKERGVLGVHGFRQEQEWHGWAEPADKVVYSDTLSKKLELSLPSWMKQQISEKAAHRGMTESSYLRDVMYQAGIPDNIERLKRKHRERMSVRVCQHQVDCIKVIQSAFPEPRSQSEIIAATLVKHWAQTLKVDQKLKKISEKSRKRS